MKNNISKLLSLPLGKQLSSDNWESFVYELGNDFVYKEIKTEHKLTSNTTHLSERITLQRFWCSDTHYKNTLHDFKIIYQELNEWVPETYIIRAPAKFSNNPSAIVTIQKRIRGKLLKDLPDYSSPSLNNLSKEVERVCKNIFNAPLDFHPSNIMIEESSNKVIFFDFGTPSDWQYFLNAKKLQEAIEISISEAEAFVTFMTPIHQAHWDKLKLI
jgi:hypothetical protein